MSKLTENMIAMARANALLLPLQDKIANLWTRDQDDKVVVVATMKPQFKSLTAIIDDFFLPLVNAGFKDFRVEPTTGSNSTFTFLAIADGVEVRFCYCYPPVEKHSEPVQ